MFEQAHANAGNEHPPISPLGPAPLPATVGCRWYPLAPVTIPAPAPSDHELPVGQAKRPDLLLALRSWQTDAYRAYFSAGQRDFLLVATPGAGKTTFALTLAAELLARGEVSAITVVTPTEHLKHQWSQAAHRLGISIDPEFSNATGEISPDFIGAAVTYAQVAAHPALHRQRTQNRRTLVVFDELHHAGDALSWGEAVRVAFEPARRRLALTGTPFRSDTNPIPFVTYLRDADGVTRSASDYVYGYGPALADGVVRPVIFLAYSGEMRWRTRAGDELARTLGAPMTSDQLAYAWRTALDPDGAWIMRVLEAADRRLTEVRRGMPDAAGLVIASDHADARAYARLLRGISGTQPVVVLSDDPAASKKIARFAGSADRWMVAVRMVSEGVDIPRLAVGVYATSVGTPLFFAQAVGRFVRARRRGETASVFLPSIPSLLRYAAELETERDHVLHSPGDAEADERELAAAQREPATSDDLDNVPFQALEASAHFDRVLYDGNEFGMTAEEEDFLGLPGLLEPDQVALILRNRKSAQLRNAVQSGKAGQSGKTEQDGKPGAVVDRQAATASGPTAREIVAALRKELNGLVAAWHHRTGQPHGAIHAELRRSCGGPQLAQASAEQIRSRIAMMHRMAKTGR